MRKFEIIYIDHNWDLKTIEIKADSEKEALDKVDKNLGSDFKILRELKHKINK